MSNYLQNRSTLARSFASVFFVVIFQAALLLALAGCGSFVPTKDQHQKKQDIVENLRELRIKTANQEHVFQIELALDGPAQAKGLMFRRDMAADHGMLFIYDMEHVVDMWMKNTVLSLDMLFVKADGTISRIARNTEPFSLKVVSSVNPVIGVLELNAGTADRLSIQAGDRLIHPLLKAK